jgi:hypothetical protein
MFGWFSSKPQPPPTYPELESPKEVAEFESLCQKKLQALYSIKEDQEGWTETLYGVDGHTDIKIFSKQLPGNSVNVAKVYGTLPVSAKAVFDFLKVFDLQTQQKYDQDLLESQIIKEIVPGQISIVYAGYRAPFGVTNREFTVVRKLIEDDNGKNVILSFSINYTDFPIKDGRVRAALLVSGWILEPLPEDSNKCMCTRIVYLDPKGSIPIFVVNMFVSKAGDPIARLREILASK